MPDLQVAPYNGRARRWLRAVRPMRDAWRLRRRRARPRSGGGLWL